MKKPPFIQISSATLCVTGEEKVTGGAERKLGNYKNSTLAFERGLELLDLTIQVSGNKRRLRELCRLRKVLVDYFMGKYLYSSSDDLWQSYFYAFAYAARIK